MELGRWIHLGHRLGECWADESRGIAYIHIPKNASSFVKGVLMGARGFWHHSETLIKCNENLIMLRDPIDRWASGIAQYLYNSKLNIPDDEIFEKITFDDHTDLQTYFLTGVDLSNATFIKVDENLRSNLSSWMIARGYLTNVNIAHAYNASHSDDRATIKTKYTKLVAENPEYMLKLKEHFKQDYELINRVKFYGN